MLGRRDEHPKGRCARYRLAAWLLLSCALHVGAILLVPAARLDEPDARRLVIDHVLLGAPARHGDTAPAARPAPPPRLVPDRGVTSPLPPPPAKTADPPPRPTAVAEAPPELPSPAAPAGAAPPATGPPAAGRAVAAEMKGAPSGSSSAAVAAVRGHENSEVPLAIPIYASNPLPEYPRIARRLGWQGEVLLRVRVSAEGAVLQVEVERTSGHPALDRAAAAAVRRWRFHPARRGAAAVESTVLVPIPFILERE